MAGSNQSNARIMPAQGMSQMSPDQIPVAGLYQATASFNSFTTTGANASWNTTVYDPYALAANAVSYTSLWINRVGLYHSTVFMPLSYTASKNRWVNLQYSTDNAATWVTYGSLLMSASAVANSMALSVSGYFQVTAAMLATAKTAGSTLSGQYPNGAVQLQVFVGSTSDNFTQNAVAWWGIHRVGMLG